jgi:hypothetical protein
MIEEVRQHLAKIAGQKCWEATNVVTGTLRLYFGGVLLGEGFREGDIHPTGEGDVLIWGDWKLCNGNDVICHSGSDDEEILYKVSELIGDTCTSFNIVSTDCWDAEIHFLSGKSLYISSDNYDIENESYIWDMAFMDIVFFFGPGSRVKDGKKRGILPYSPFPPDGLPHIDMEEKINAMKQKIPYDELLAIGKEIVAKSKDKT